MKLYQLKMVILIIKDKLKEVQTTISTGEKDTDTDTDTDTEVKPLEATGTIPVFIPKSWKMNIKKFNVLKNKLFYKQYLKKLVIQY